MKEGKGRRELDRHLGRRINSLRPFLISKETPFFGKPSSPRTSKSAAGSAKTPLFLIGNGQNYKKKRFFGCRARAVILKRGFWVCGDRVEMIIDVNIIERRK